MIKEKSLLWQKTSMLIGRCFAKYCPTPPSFYTLTSLFLGLSAVLSAYSHFYMTTICLFFMAGFFDVVDGAVARTLNKASNLGAFLDGNIDRFVDFSIIFSYFFFNITPVWLDMPQLICITSFVVIMPSFTVAYANHRGAVDDDNETLIWRIMNRGEMYILMLSILIVSLISSVWAGYLLMLLIILSTITIIQTMGETIYYANKST